MAAAFAFLAQPHGCDDADCTGCEGDDDGFDSDDEFFMNQHWLDDDIIPVLRRVATGSTSLYDAAPLAGLPRCVALHLVSWLPLQDALPFARASSSMLDLMGMHFGQRPEGAHASALRLTYENSLARRQRLVAATFEAPMRDSSYVYALSDGLDVAYSRHYDHLIERACEQLERTELATEAGSQPGGGSGQAASAAPLVGDSTATPEQVQAAIAPADVGAMLLLAYELGFAAGTWLGSEGAWYGVRCLNAGVEELWGTQLQVGVLMRIGALRERGKAHGALAEISAAALAAASRRFVIVADGEEVTRGSMRYETHTLEYPREWAARDREGARRAVEMEGSPSEGNEARSPSPAAGESQRDEEGDSAAGMAAGTESAQSGGGTGGLEWWCGECEE